jgi:hypothetical protein
LNSECHSQEILFDDSEPFWRSGGRGQKTAFSRKVDSLFTAARWLGDNEFGTPAALDRPVLARNRLRG